MRRPNQPTNSTKFLERQGKNVACNYAFAVSLKRCKRQVFSVGRYVGLLVPSQPYLDELSITFETSDEIFGAGPWPYPGHVLWDCFFRMVDWPTTPEWSCNPRSHISRFPPVWQEFRIWLWRAKCVLLGSTKWPSFGWFFVKCPWEQTCWYTTKKRAKKEVVFFFKWFQWSIVKVLG